MEKKLPKTKAMTTTTKTKQKNSNRKKIVSNFTFVNRGGSRAAATTKMERFVIIVNGCKLQHP